MAALCHFPSAPASPRLFPLSRLLSPVSRASKPQYLLIAASRIENSIPNASTAGSRLRCFSSSSNAAASPVALPSDERESRSLGDITRPDFPILRQVVNGFNLVYFDNAATSQKPSAVLDVLNEYYETCNSNVHRGAHYLSLFEMFAYFIVVEISAKATDAYEEARTKVATFVNAMDRREIVFTRNATEAINLVAYSWGLSNLRSGDEVCFIAHC
ncbi:hypothetical protein BHE74_00034258 [Ensete ventricosum]|nr:hypothetical protein BHE74_00034258 [Ensete ventricosum]RZS10837.1 hypothetical protein BHM03_00042107 [Ensete ventricosum]